MIDNEIILSTPSIKDRIIDKAPTPSFGKVYGIPEGGYHIAYLIEALGLGVIVDDPEEADCIVDDIIDSGKTIDAWKSKYPNKKFFIPYIKENPQVWYVFPWEATKKKSGEDIVTRMIEYIGEDPKREGLVKTPDRVVRAWKELYGGYSQDPEKILGAIFESDSDQMVICKDIEYYSQCEHHLIPFYGKAHIAYIPDGHVVGLSKLARLVDVYAKRMQIQENLTQQIARAIMKYVPKCQGVGVVVEGKHLCMCGRGVAKQNSIMKTSALYGVFRATDTRAEFFNLIRS